MATSKGTNGRAGVGDLLREQVATAQARVEQMEADAKHVLGDLMARGRASRRDLEQLMHRLSKQDWSFPEVRHTLSKQLRVQGVELKGKAEALRVEALERVVELQSRAVQFLGAASRDQLEDLSRELDKLSRRLDRAEKVTRSKKPSKPSSREV